MENAINKKRYLISISSFGFVIYRRNYMFYKGGAYGGM